LGLLQGAGTHRRRGGPSLNDFGPGRGLGPVVYAKLYGLTVTKFLFLLNPGGGPGGGPPLQFPVGTGSPFKRGQIIRFVFLTWTWGGRAEVLHFLHGTGPEKPGRLFWPKAGGFPFPFQPRGFGAALEGPKDPGKSAGLGLGQAGPEKRFHKQWIISRSDGLFGSGRGAAKNQGASPQGCGFFLQGGG